MDARWKCDVIGARSPVVVAEKRDVVTAAELDEMSPTERAEAVRARVIDDLDQLPQSFRSRVEASARSLSNELNHPVSE